MSTKVKNEVLKIARQFANVQASIQEKTEMLVAACQTDEQREYAKRFYV